MTDFGFAARIGEGAEAPRATGGTLGYMAPEQLDPAWGALGQWTDVHGLGAVLTALLTGRPPGSAASQSGAVRDFPDGRRAEAIAHDASGAPESVLSACASCLALWPAERPGSARELARTLRAGVGITP